MSLAQDKRILEVITKSYANCEDFSLKNEKVYFPLCLVKSKIFGNRIISIPFMDVGEIPDNFPKKDFENLIEDFRRKNFKFIKIKLNNFSKKFEKKFERLKSLKFIEKPSKQQEIILIKNPKKFWKNFHKHTRNDIRKAKKSNLKLIKIHSKKELKNFYKLYFKAMKRFGTPPHSFKFFANLKKIFKEDFIGINCYKNNHLIASIILLIYKDYAYLWFNVSNPKFRIFRPNDLLYWVSIKNCFKKKIRYLDIGQVDSSNKKSGGIFKFKKKWMGEIFEKKEFYYFFTGKNEKTNQKNLKKFRKIWRNLPSFIIKKIGPKINSQLGN